MFHIPIFKRLPPFVHIDQNRPRDRRTGLGGVDRGTDARKSHCRCRRPVIGATVVFFSGDVMISFEWWVPKMGGL